MNLAQIITKTTINKLALLLLLGLATLACSHSALAANSSVHTSKTAWPAHRGFYLGAEFGHSSVDYKKSLWNSTDAATIDSIKTSGFSEHITAGLIFSTYLAGELTVNYVEKPVVSFNNHTSSKFRNNIVALMLRGSIPVLPSQRLLIMPKLGFGYVAREGLAAPDGKVLLKDNEYFRPVYSVGLDWRLTPHWDMTASWLQAAPHSSVKLPATNFIGAGFYYRWR